MRLEDCPMHRYHFLDDMLLCAAVDGTARLVQMEAGFQWVKRGAPKHLQSGHRHQLYMRL